MKKGDILSELQFYRVKSFTNGFVILETDAGEEIRVDQAYVDGLLNSASDFKDTIKITRTELTEIFLANSRMAMTVNYNKQVKPDDIAEEIAQVHGNMTLGTDKVAFKKLIKKALNLKGEERTMVGRHYATQDVNGRVNFVDMEAVNDSKKDYDTRLRLVDPRTLNYVIVGNIKYQVK